MLFERVLELWVLISATCALLQCPTRSISIWMSLCLIVCQIWSCGQYKCQKGCTRSSSASPKLLEMRRWRNAASCGWSTCAWHAEWGNYTIMTWLEWRWTRSKGFSRDFGLELRDKGAWRRICDDEVDIMWLDCYLTVVFTIHYKYQSLEIRFQIPFSLLFLHILYCCRSAA